MALLENIPLPQVKHFKIEFEIDIDKKFISKCCKFHPKSKKQKQDFAQMKWPEAVKALYREFSNREHQARHIISVCEKALDENIIPIKDALWNEMLVHDYEKEV